jgi:hypothetical protein
MPSIRVPAIRAAAGPRPYHRLDLTDVRLPPAVLVGTRGRAAMLDAAREAGYPARTVTPALTRFSRVYVIALGSDPDAGTVVLGTADGREVTVKLPVDVRYRILPPTRVEHLLAAVEREYPPGSLTAALAEALSAVLHVGDRQHAIGQSAIPVHTVTEALATPLNAFLKPWADDKPEDASGDESQGAAGAAVPAPGGSELSR